MKKLNNYLNLCTQFYDITKPSPPQDAYNFYKIYLQNSKGNILEPMCGTGRFLLPFLQDGFNIHGFDASQSMLNELIKKAKQRNLSANVCHGYVEQIQQNNTYDLIFIPSGSFGLLTDKNSIIHALQTFYNILSHGGTLVFEIETCYALPQLGVWKGSKCIRADGKTILLSSCAFLNNDICLSIAKYELIHNNQIIQTEIEEYNIRFYAASAFVSLLKTIGFKEIKLLKAFSHFETPKHNDETIIYECKK